MTAHALDPQSVSKSLDSSESGLSNAEAGKRVSRDGLNAVNIGKDENLAQIFLRQFQSPLIYVLLAAAVVVVALSKLSDGLIIFFVLLVNAVVGTLQEGRARRALRALRDFSRSRAVVVRENIEEEIDDRFLAVGDVVVLRSGDKVPADMRILDEQNLRVDESALTGESEPVEKENIVLPEDTPMPDRRNMLYKGTLAVAGEGRGMVVAVGSKTFVGSIGEKLSSIESEMPLRGKIRQFSKILGLLVFLSVALVFVLGLWREVSPKEMFFTATAIAVSVIPEGLPVVITLILARGVHRMAKRQALVKNMQAVEALGQASVIAVDKTGTITKNELTVLKFYVAHKTFAVSGEGFKPRGELYLNGAAVSPSNHPEALLAGKIAALSSQASLTVLPSGAIRTFGDPTEVALLVFGEKLGFKKSNLLAEEPAVLEEPFNQNRRYSLGMYRANNGFLTVVLGEPESILNKSRLLWFPEGERSLGRHDRELLEQQIKDFGSIGLRLIAFAMHQSDKANIDLENLPPLAFVGFFAMADVLRPEVAAAVDLAKANGLKTVMITGDHLGTATAIARAAHIFNENDLVMSGAELSRMEKDELAGKLDRVSVFGRVLPEHKLLIVEAFKQRGDIIGMTGDGVNDALSLRAAHLGLAMGNGTEVAKEASDIVLLDNNFKTIIAAIEEGRSIYATIKKVVLYLVSTSIGELLTIVGALSLGSPLPLLPSQILWLNLVTDGFMVVALAFEPNQSLAESGRGRSAIFDGHRAFRAVVMGVVMMVGSLLLFRTARAAGGVALASTVALTALSVFQWFNAWNCRSRRTSAFYRPASNPYLLLALFGAVTMHLLALHHPFLQKLLHTTPLSLWEWLLIIATAFSIVAVEEVRKLMARANL